jgi:hypothetical protein
MLNIMVESKLEEGLVRTLVGALVADAIVMVEVEGGSGGRLAKAAG